MSANYLCHETSPYLLQHAQNPVEWYPWGEQALNRALRENKPILLSVGYSACHWCHVMAHESFEDAQTASIMNDLFINIKVDREERPDIDKIYQTSFIVLTQRSGGWPLTMFLTPADHIPFFAGTYFPKKARHGLPAFKDLLKYIAEIYYTKPEQVQEQNQSLQNQLNAIYQSSGEPVTLENNILLRAKNQLMEVFDRQHGGFGKAPKFPHPGNLDLLLRDYYRSQQHGIEDNITFHLLFFTLEKMAAGGLFDHVSGGFYRYSVDDYWMIPHFEKMLYDNGLLLSIYTQAYLASRQERFKSTALDTAEWIIREMQAPEGGYFSSLDADFDGVEGKYYTWDMEQIKTLLDKKELDLVNQRFGLERGPNFEDKYHLNEWMDFDEYSRQHCIDIATCNETWQRARDKLFTYRSSNTPPDRDDKILTGWNALVIKSMSIASRVFDKDEYSRSALDALEFIRRNMITDQGRLYASYKDGKAHLNAYLDDYAFLLDALLEYLQTQWQSSYLLFAIEIANTLLAHFEDQQYGGFYFTSNDHENLIQRPKISSDEATPSGNGVAAYSLLRLGYLLSETRYIDAAERTINNAGQQINNNPMAYGSLLRCYEELIEPPTIIIIRGIQPTIESWQRTCQKQYQPDCMVFSIPDDAQNLPESLAIKNSAAGATRAFLCHGLECQAPIESLENLTQVLKDPPRS